MSRARLLLGVLLCLWPCRVASQLTERLYQEACDNGNVSACNVFGLMNERGEGVTQDLSRAVGLYERACEGGLPVGCTNLARMYEAGAGVPRDVARANVLYQVACEGGELLACDLAPADNPLRPGRINGRVMEEGKSRGLSDVDITVVGQTEVRTLSNRQGQFTLRDLEPGPAQVRLTRLGYAPRTVLLVVQPGRTVDLSATMSTRPIELEAIRVTVRPRFLELSGFYARGDQGFGHQFGPMELETLDLERVSNVLSRVPGVSVRRTGPGRSSAVSMRGVGSSTGSCRLLVYVDGLRMSTSYDLDQIHPDQIEAVEVYHGVATPIQYMGNGCGVVLLWTRR